MSPTVNPKIKFRYDINALRAIAVTGVILFHYKIPFFPGGFSGVDIFFVISGYLMSRIIINSINTGNFSLTDFYGKRLKRIVPALLFLIAILTLVCLFLYFPVEYQSNEKNSAASILFVSNILYWTNTSYFDPVSDTNLFLHTWSLSVEWQFYLLYPLILLSLNNLVKKRKRMFQVLSASTIVIFLLTAIITNYKPTASFYLLPTRAWEMLFGGVALYVEDIIKGYKYRKALAYIGYIFIFFGFTFINNSAAWPGALTIIPVLATFLVIIADTNDFSILKSKPIQFLGKISYSLYLWHWPIYAIAEYLGAPPTIYIIVFLVSLSTAMAYLSFRYIESMKLKNKTIIVSMCVLFGVTSTLAFTHANDRLFKKNAISLSTYKQNHINEVIKQYEENGCFIVPPLSMKDFNKDKCLHIDPDKKNILFIGDSHAAHLFKALSEKLTTQNINLIKASASGCAPILNTTGASSCTDVINYIYNDFIARNSNKIDGIMISANWFDKGDPEKLVEDLKATIKYLNGYKLKTVVLGQSKVYVIPYPSIIAKKYEFNLNVENKFLNAKAYELNVFLKTRLSPYYVDIYGLDSFAKLSSNDEPYMFDESHLTGYGADQTTKLLLTDKKFTAFLNP